jgi:hypothetical protein
MVTTACPTCYWENPANAIECEKCRTTLKRKGTTNLLSPDVLPRYNDAPLLDVPPGVLVLAVAGHTDAPLVLPPYRNVYLGRQFPGENPPIDLTPFGAHELGVSRQHALLVANEQGYMIEDLASSNGTWLNTLMLSPYVRYEVRSCDRVQLGRLPLYIYFDL